MEINHVNHVTAFLKSIKGRRYFYETLKSQNIDFIDKAFASMDSFFEQNPYWSTSSQTRGKCRGFVPIRKNGIKAAEEGKSLEVPLARALAKANKYHNEMPILSGIGNNSKSNKKRSIDLVTDSHELIELKAWEGGDSPLYAIVEVLLYLRGFLCVREKDKELKTRNHEHWKDWEDFDVTVMAPDEYFTRKWLPENKQLELFLALVGKIEYKAKEIYPGKLKGLYIKELTIQRQDFISAVAPNERALTDKTNTVSLTQNLYEKLNLTNPTTCKILYPR